MARPEPLPIKVDRITARLLETLSPKRRKEVEDRLVTFRRYSDRPSDEIRLDTVDLSHPHVNGVSIKVTSKRVETYVHLKGVTIRNGRQVSVMSDLPESVLASLGKKAANDIIGTELLEGHTILYARERDIFLREEPWVMLNEIPATGQDLEAVTIDQFYDRLEALGIVEVDAVLVNYIPRLGKKLHIALARIENRCADAPNTSVSTRLDDLTEYSSGERAFFSIGAGRIDFTLESPSGNARYSKGYLSCWSKRLSPPAQMVERMCYHLRKQAQGKNRKTKMPYRTFAQIRENLKYYRR